ncbi:hypothetical protein [Rhodobacter aestuarii]|uniref:hypothetical protein n=1 Tax=Rhodobacter aestuarii TaxID=453582 RepID=UPI000970E02B|nr:hypothetical protein [Rhodobacter aestuarii]
MAFHVVNAQFAWHYKMRDPFVILTSRSARGMSLLDHLHGWIGTGGKVSRGELRFAMFFFCASRG